ncbi:hypothetical protein DD689_27890 [Escherichia coli]|nr:hypothetical protein DD768_27605 [Escherichia coli]PWH35746.1 hypothetical protein DD689_27890 [Escherichia coli]PWH49274.1 hypothetical protein DD680_27870 [Escherichia coli]PWH57938.1 hypothetical protein DD647_27830 [Escherichia coli]
MTDFGGKTSIFSHPVYLFLRKFSLQDSRGGSQCFREADMVNVITIVATVACVSGYLKWIFQKRTRVVSSWFGFQQICDSAIY